MAESRDGSSDYTDQAGQGRHLAPAPAPAPSAHSHPRSRAYALTCDRRSPRLQGGGRGHQPLAAPPFPQSHLRICHFTVESSSASQLVSPIALPDSDPGQLSHQFLHFARRPQPYSLNLDTLTYCLVLHFHQLSIFLFNFNFPMSSYPRLIYSITRVHTHLQCKCFLFNYNYRLTVLPKLACFCSKSSKAKFYCIYLTFEMSI
jgi:hypothetical protein